MKTYLYFITTKYNYEVQSVAELATIIISTEPADFQIEVLEDGVSTGHGLYEMDGECVIVRAYEHECLPLEFDEEYGAAQGLCALINEELAKQLAA